MKTILIALAAALMLPPLFAAVPDPATYVPDASKSDIYLPYLKRIPLSGWWKLNKVSNDRKNNPDDDGRKGNFQAADFDDSGWTKDLVPNDIHVPFLIRIPEKTGWAEMQQAIPREVREWGGVAYFRRDFTAPELGGGERAILTFDEVGGDFTLYVNGRKIGEGAPGDPPDRYLGPGSPQSFDITDALRPGKKNNITLRLFSSGEPVRWGWAAKAGILGLVYLDIRPAAWTANILVTPQKNLKDVLFDCIVSGSDRKADEDGWTGEIFEWNSGKKVASFPFGNPHGEDGIRMISGTGRIDDARLWSCESPFLYGVRVRNARGEVAGVQRFGMRVFGVKDGNFVLNGKPVMLRGLTHHGHALYQFFRHGWMHAFRLNVDDVCRRYWQLLGKDANVNHIRIHSETFPRGLYDVFDEFGIIVTDELAYPAIRIKTPERADQIDVKGFDGASDPRGNLRPEFVKKTKERIRNSYSHPSICTYSFGNEIRQYDNPQVEGLLNHLYDLYGSVDKQQRPRTNSSGRFWKDGSNVKELLEREKLDYIDTHDYTGSINNFPLAYCEPVVKHFHETVRKYCGENAPPVVNGETVYMSDHYFQKIFDPIWKSESDPQPDWDKFLYMIDRWSKDEPQNSFLSYYWVRNWGSKGYQFNRPVGRGVYTERILEVQRKSWPDQDGYENLSDPYFSMSNAWPFDRAGFTKNVAFDYLARVNSPVIAVLDYIAPNRFAGETVTSRVTAVNNGESEKKAVRFEAYLERDGKKESPVSLDLGDLAPAEKKVVPFEFNLPAKPGTWKLVYQLVSGDKVLNKRDFELNLNSRQELFRPIATKKKVALYDASEVFGGLKPYSTARLLKAFGVPFQSIRSFDKLGGFDVLVVGAESIDGRVQEGASQIRAFVENGGRLLVFEQNRTGRIPFLPELEYVLAGPGQFSEILQADHPALAEMTQAELFCWNQGDWSIYRNYISPISRAALLLGGDTTQWGSDHFGMVAAHLRLGKGDVLLCQAEATKCLKDDSGAARFARNLLETVLNDATRSKASEFVGLPVPKFAPLAVASAFRVDLRNAANRAFADETAGDGKGGWTDQGPDNDLASFPTGDQVFNGIPFGIIKPGENGGRACVFVSNHPARHLPPESKPVLVNAKLKRLLFLHSAGWVSEKQNPQAGEYVVTYASGRQAVVPLVAGENIGDWWNASAKKHSNCECGWSGMNPSSTVGVYLFEWTNPHPEDPIRDIVLKAKNNAVVGLVGLTGEKEK